MTEKAWRKRPAPPIGFARELGLPPFQAHLLYARGIRTPDEQDAFLRADAGLAHNPSLLPDMEKAVARVRKALDARETIGVFGDFDTDGISGTALIVQALRDLGANVVSYLPHRTDEGHGLNIEAVETLRSHGVSLLITVDCGVSSYREVESARGCGIDTIITDHHTLPVEPPRATAIIHPLWTGSRYPFMGLTGAGLAYKLAEALYADLGRPRPDHLMELAALGTVSDLGPLTGENRYIVRRGLESLNSTQHMGLRALIERAGLKLGSLDSESLSFQIIPRLNAAGRLGDAMLSLDLLTASKAEIAVSIAERLERQNQERKLLAESSIADARRQVETGAGLPPIIIVEKQDWLPGILGLIAGNLSEMYYRPVIAVLVEEAYSRASARSIPEFNIVDALGASKGLFSRYGGHPQAAGFALPTRDLPQLKAELLALAHGKLRHAQLSPAVDVDCEITPALLTDKNLEFIQRMQPFGEGNPQPVFLTRYARVLDARKVGQRQDHLKMRLSHDGATWDAIAFRQGNRPVVPGNVVDVVYTAGLNTWNGHTSLQLNVQDFKVVR
ncbi:MAG: single-stranded-DNA-specific exonuclease RecJ [SAR202 cluster bacterium]|nr:single-stranded-DNA-specific exonuclease RecJ [SAR202 cluster bacterium]